QTSTIIIERNASLGEAVHVKDVVSTPKLFSVPFIAPKSELSIKRQTTPTTTGGSIMGTSSNVRKIFLPRSLESRSRASESPIKNSSVNASEAKTKVCAVAEKKKPSENNLVKFPNEKCASSPV